MRTPHFTRLITTWWLAVALAGCGGGGGGDSAAAAPSPAPGPGPAPAPAPGPAPAPVPAPAPGPAPAPATTCALPNFVSTAMARINQWRATGATCGSRGAFAPAPALAWNTLLTQAAAAHSQDMASHNLFSHTGSDGSTLSSRVDATGYAWRSLGENIAAGQTGIAEVVDGWIASEGHCANLLNPAFSEVGLACVSGSASTTYGTYWTMELAQPR